MRIIIVGLCAALIISLTGCTGAATRSGPPAAASGGNIPLGMWKLNRQRSSQLEPVDQVLWIVKDNGRFLIWVLVSTDAQGMVRVNTWDGPYDGEPARVVGTPMMSQISSGSPGTLQSRGTIEGVGPFTEDCTVTAGGRRFLCHGEVTSSDGTVRRWVDDFDWVSPSPR
jgi:hypothetical protein